MKFDTSIAGHKAVAANDNAQWARLVGGQGGTLRTGDYAVLTGWYVTDTLGRTICQIESDPTMGIIASDNITLSSAQYASYSNREAQALVNGIITNNRAIYENNLLCGRFRRKLTTSQQKQVAALQQRLEARNSALVDSGVLGDLKQSYPKGYILYYDDLQALCNENKIGIVVSTTAMIIITAIVVASMGTTAYFAYKAYYNESVDDVKFSNELTKILSEKLTDEEYAQLKSETAGLVTKAKLTSKLGAFGGKIKFLLYALLGAGAAYGVYKFVKR